jgi:hypothetical protein
MKNRVLLVVAVSTLASAGCSKLAGSVIPPGGSPENPGGGPPSSPSDPLPPPPFEAVSPAASAAKVKDILTGLPLAGDELTAVSNDRAALRALIDGWMALPQFKEKMLEFWKSAFQQTQLDVTDLDEQLRLDSADVNREDQRRMLSAVEESFTRTVLALVEAGRPFTETVTTTRFMLNVPLMVALSYMDAAPRNDTNRAVPAGYWLMNKHGGQNFRMTMVTGLDPLTGVVTQIPIAETLNPASPNFMKWNFQQPDPARYMPCAEPVTVTGARAIERVFGALFGSRDACQGAPSGGSQFTDADWNSWRMVEIRPPRGAEERTVFWDLAKLRDPATTELVMAMPRVGFMTTLGFFANWPTNPSNTFRVTTNQALIVALGRSFDDRTTTVQVSETSVEALHVQPNTVCYACHVTLDPMRDFFRQSYSITYYQQLEVSRRNPVPAEASFTVDGSTPVRGRGVQTFAQAVATHPRFALAWAQKLCHFANASSCQEEDPEFLRVVDAFRASNHDWKTLVRELYSSPLVTYADKTQTTAAEGAVIGIARRETLCTRLSNRLGISDACNIKGQSTLRGQAATSARNLSFGIAGSSYARADETPVMPHDPNLFFSSATEKLCMLLAAQLVEGTGGGGGNGAPPPRWRPAQFNPALDDFVAVVMGIPANDPRSAKLRYVLASHYDASIAAGERPGDALRSTFVLACSSPLAVSSGL